MRIRTLKPEWLDDERLLEAGSDGRVLSVALILLADDYGRGRAGEAWLAARVFPNSRDPRGTLQKVLGSLRGWFVDLYELDGQRYYAIRNWAKHQRVHKPGQPRVPDPETSEVAWVPGSPRKIPGSPRKIPGSLPTDQDQDQDQDQDRTQTSNSTPADAGTPPRPPGSVAVREVFDLWRELWGKTERTKLDAKRRRAIDRALKAYSREDVERSLRGYAASSYHRGENPSQRAYDELCLHLRDSEHIEAGWGLGGPQGAASGQQSLWAKNVQALRTESWRRRERNDTLGADRIERQAQEVERDGPVGWTGWVEPDAGSPRDTRREGTPTLLGDALAGAFGTGRRR